MERALEGGHLPELRVVLIDMPRILREIIRETISVQPDMDVVAELDASWSVPDSVDRYDPDVVVVSGDSARIDELGRALLQRGSSRALAVSPDGNESFLVELRPHQVPLGELSPEALLAAVRATPDGHSST
jgi:DNA-binding NarL/FixJ family response regulator